MVRNLLDFELFYACSTQKHSLIKSYHHLLKCKYIDKYFKRNNPNINQDILSKIKIFKLSF